MSENIMMTKRTKTEEMKTLLMEHPGFSPFVMLKLSLIRYGAVLTEEAEKQILEQGLSFGTDENFGLSFGNEAKWDVVPGPILLRDSTFVYVNYGEKYDDPYVIDWDSQKKVFVLLENAEKQSQQIVEEIGFVTPPRFYSKKTSAGTPMRQIADVRAQKLILNAFQRCCFWKDKEQCAFCAFFTAGGKIHVLKEADVRETIAEAMKEPGRFSEIYLSGGTDTSGNPAFSNEVDRYIRILKAAGEPFQGRFPSQLMAPAYPKEFLERIYQETGVTSYSADLEIASPALFAKYCPGKERAVGYDEWIKRLCDAVDVFGRGNVYSQVVTGAEISGPEGLSEEEGFESSVRACEYLAQHGVILLSTIFRPHPAAKLGMVEMPPLSYLVRITEAFHEIHVKYGLRSVDDDYKHCGNHPDSDLERADPEPDDILILGKSDNPRIQFVENSVGLPAQMPNETGDSTNEKEDSPNEKEDSLNANGNLPREKEEALNTENGTILFGLPQEYCGQGSLLIRGLWEDRDVPAVLDGVKIMVKPYRCHIAGAVFEKVLLQVREENPSADISCVWELKISGINGQNELKDFSKELSAVAVPFEEIHLDRLLN